MLTIRLSRRGRKNLAQFRLVVQEKSQNPKSGRSVAILGAYNPHDPKNTLQFDREAALKYLKNGAVPSETAARLMKKAGIEEAAKFITRYTHKLSEEAQKAKAAAAKAAAEEHKAKKEAAAKAAEEAKAAASAPAEAPAEEVAAA